MPIPEPPPATDEIKLLSYVMNSVDPDREGLGLHLIYNLIYLCDWKSVIETGKPITNYRWFHAGLPEPVGKEEDTTPYAMSCLYGEQYFEMDMGKGYFNRFTAKYDYEIDVNIKPIVCHVIKTYKFYKSEDQNFNRLVTSTYPIFMGQRYKYMDLIASAEKYAWVKTTLDKKSEESEAPSPPAVTR